jgi:hypothetical protein
MAKGKDHGGITINPIAGESLATKEHLAVKMGTTGEVTLCGAGELAIGILVKNTADNAPAPVRINGTARWMAAGSMNAGIRVMSDASGKVVAWTLGSNAVGLSLEAATADEDVIEVLLFSSIDTDDS